MDSDKVEQLHAIVAGLAALQQQLADLVTSVTPAEGEKTDGSSSTTPPVAAQ